MKNATRAFLLLVFISFTYLGCTPEETPVTEVQAPTPTQILPPTIESFSPQSAFAGEQVTINGTGFGQLPIGIQVFFGDVEAQVVSASSTKIVVVVPEGAISAPIRLVSGGTSAVSEVFTVPIQLSTTELELFTLDSELLSLSGINENTQVVWSSADENVAVVDESGNVKGIKEGTTEIKVTVEDIETSVTINVKRSIYVTGYDSSNDKDIATIWKNGVPIYLTDGENDARATSVFVTDTDVYVSGYETSDNNIDVAKVWKNGELLYNVSGNSSRANSIFIFENDVYFSGVQNGNAAYWQNGLGAYLNGGTPGEAFGLFVNDNSIYVSGNVENSPAIWTGTEKNELTYNQNFFSIALDIAATDTDTYAVGFDYVENPILAITATIWKNGGEPQYLETTDRSIARSIFIDNDDVYVVGGNAVNNIELPVLWKNNDTPVVLDFEGGSANSVYVYKGDVYIAGYNTKEAQVWENDIQMPLFQGIENANFGSVFVK
ncbi:MAG: IPT/TIG domain-containing protein [Bacteroidota bacterium]